MAELKKAVVARTTESSRQRFIWFQSGAKRANMFQNGTKIKRQLL